MNRETHLLGVIKARRPTKRSQLCSKIKILISNIIIGQCPLRMTNPSWIRNLGLHKASPRQTARPGRSFLFQEVADLPVFTKHPQGKQQGQVELFSSRKLRTSQTSWPSRSQKGIQASMRLRMKLACGGSFRCSGTSVPVSRVPRHHA